MIPNRVFPMLLYLAFVSAGIPEDSVRFFFYNNTTEPVELQTKNLSDNHGLFANKQLKVLCHGLAASSSVDWYKTAIEAYSRMGYGILALDWAFYAFSGYVKAIVVCQDIAALIGEFIIRFSEAFNTRLQDFHAIGHSLGGHIVGFSGKYIFAKRSEKIGRITGLDPAGPLYNDLPKERRLSADDADFVDVIHTNAGILGIIPSVGHVDFYPDGGVYQLSCGPAEIECSHNLAAEYFVKSIEKADVFQATLCESYPKFTMGYCNNGVKAVMGESCMPTVKGDYFLTIDFEQVQNL